MLVTILVEAPFIANLSMKNSTKPVTEFTFSLGKVVFFSVGS